MESPNLKWMRTGGSSISGTPFRVESVIPFGEFHMHKNPTGQQRLLVEVRVDKEHVRANSNNDEDTETHPETLKGTYLGKL